MSLFNGLTSIQADALLLKHGENVLPEKKRVSELSHFSNQFASPLIYILVAAALITCILGEYSDALVISLAIFINTLLGYYQESKAEKALQALQSMLDPTVRV